MRPPVRLQRGKPISHCPVLVIGAHDEEAQYEGAGGAAADYAAEAWRGWGTAWATAQGDAGVKYE